MHISKLYSMLWHIFYMYTIISILSFNQRTIHRVINQNNEHKNKATNESNLQLIMVQAMT